MKQLFCIAAIIALCLCFTTTISECDPDKHQFGEWLITIWPEDDHIGEQTRVCKICGYLQRQQFSFDTPPESSTIKRESHNEKETYEAMMGYIFEAPDEWDIVQNDETTFIMQEPIANGDILAEWQLTKKQISSRYNTYSLFTDLNDRLALYQNQDDFHCDIYRSQELLGTNGQYCDFRYKTKENLLIRGRIHGAIVGDSMIMIQYTYPDYMLSVKKTKYFNQTFDHARTTLKAVLGSTNTPLQTEMPKAKQEVSFTYPIPSSTPKSSRTQIPLDDAVLKESPKGTFDQRTYYLSTDGTLIISTNVSGLTGFDYLYVNVDNDNDWQRRIELRNQTESTTYTWEKFLGEPYESSGVGTYHLSLVAATYEGTEIALDTATLIVSAGKPVLPDLELEISETELIQLKADMTIGYKASVASSYIDSIMITSWDHIFDTREVYRYDGNSEILKNKIGSFIISPSWFKENGIYKIQVQMYAGSGQVAFQNLMVSVEHLQEDISNPAEATSVLTDSSAKDNAETEWNLPILTYGQYEYSVYNDGKAVVVGYRGNDRELSIPWNLDGHMITEIGDGAFKGKTALRTIKLPIGVRIIKANAFEGCTSLSAVLLPDYLETIEDEAFKGCKALTSLFLPDSVTELGEDCFEEWTVLSGNPGSLAESYSAWAGQDYQQAAVTTPTPKPVSADFQYEIRRGGIYITSYTGHDYEVHVPAEIDGYPVRTIGINAFSSRYEVESVILPEGLTSLDKNAFRFCTGLLSVKLPSTLKSIGDHCFYLCDILPEITIPEGVTEIGLRAFQGCKQLRDVTLPKSLKSISNYTFYDCHRSLIIHAPKGSSAEKFAHNKGYNYTNK